MSKLRSSQNYFFCIRKINLVLNTFEMDRLFRKDHENSNTKNIKEYEVFYLEICHQHFWVLNMDL